MNKICVDINLFQEKCVEFLDNNPLNYINESNAVRADLIGMKIFDSPIFAFGDANDELFNKLKSNDVVTDEYMLPHDWLNNCQSVISYFLPFTKQIRMANKEITKFSDEWAQGRMDGQIMLNNFTVFITDFLNKLGYESIAPSLDKRFKIGNFTSNWSERHTGYICGLGTFGMSKGLITAKGMAGRLGSVITNLNIETTKRPYNNLYDYCIKCNLCIKRCPAHAIQQNEDLNKAKDHVLCKKQLNESFTKYYTVLDKRVMKYGCGKCQVNVPCEDKIPNKNFNS